MLKIQVGSANQIDRGGKGKHHWEDIATGETKKEVIKQFLTALNSDDVNNTNSFFRLVTHTGKIINF